MFDVHEVRFLRWGIPFFERRELLEAADPARFPDRRCPECPWWRIELEGTAK